jgi:hypothetical protein
MIFFSPSSKEILSAARLSVRSTKDTLCRFQAFSRSKKHHGISLSALSKQPLRFWPLQSPFSAAGKCFHIPAAPHRKLSEE